MTKTLKHGTNVVWHRRLKQGETCQTTATFLHYAGKVSARILVAGIERTVRASSVKEMA
jgi:hypothetical protein